MHQPSVSRKLGSPTDAVSPLWARPGTKVVVATGLALLALLATSRLAAASDPSGTVSDLAAQASTEITSPSSASSEPSLSAEVTASSEPSAEVTASSEPSLSAEVTASSEPSLSLSAEPPSAPAAGEPPVEPAPAPDTLLAPVTELVADQLAAAEVPDPNEFVASSMPPDNLPLLSTDRREILGIADLGASEDAGEVVAVLFAPAAQTSTEPIDGTDGPGTAQPRTFTPVIDGRDADGEPARPDTASETVLNSTVRPLAAERGRYREGDVASVAVPRIAAERGGGSGTGTWTPDPQFGAILAALAGAAAWRIFSLRMPPIPTGIWLAAPVPPG